MLLIVVRLDVLVSGCSDCVLVLIVVVAVSTVAVRIVVSISCSFIIVIKVIICFESEVI